MLRITNNPTYTNIAQSTITAVFFKWSEILCQTEYIQITTITINLFIRQRIQCVEIIHTGSSE